MGSSVFFEKMGKILALTSSLLVGSSLASLSFQRSEAWLKEWDCDSCSRFSRDFIGVAISEESIAGQIELLLPICDTTDDPAGCQAILPPFWTALATAMWPGLFSTENLCGELCTASKMNPLAPKEACFECMMALEQIDAAMLTVETEVFIVLWLDENFCPTQDILDAQTCHDVMPTLIPLAMQALFVRDPEEVNDGHFYFCSEVHNAC